MSTCVRAKIKDPKALTDAVFIGQWFVAEEALAGGIVQKVCDVEELLDTAVQMGKATIGKNNLSRDTVMHLKSDLYSDIVSACQNETLNSKGILQGFLQFGRKSKL